MVRIISLILSLIFFMGEAIAGEFLVVGHRGAAGLMPENTMAGFEKAVELGVDIIELDVHLTADNEVVIYHDARLNPATTRDDNGDWVDGDLLIKNMTLAQIRTYDVGKLNHSEKYAQKYPDQESVEGERIPSLRDVLQLVRSSENKPQIFIELKYSPLNSTETKTRKEIANAVADIVKEENMVNRINVISFDWGILSYFHNLLPEVPTGYVTIAKKDFDTLKINEPGVSPWTSKIDIDDYDSIAMAIKSAGGTYWITNFKHATGHKKYLTSDTIKNAHSVGIKVIAWTPDKASDMKKLIEMGVDGITTNRPDILLSFLEN